MEIYIVVKETKNKDVILGVYSTEKLAVTRIGDAYEEFFNAQQANPSLEERCYIVKQTVNFENNDVEELAKKACPEPDSFFHQTDESIYCMGFIDGFNMNTKKKD